VLKTTQDLQKQWDRAVERAAEDSSPVQELDPSSLQEISGLYVKSSVRAGAAPGKPTAGPSYCSMKCGQC
jgi:hypothetical protein